MDALNRFSSAQYGYNYTFPTAVASNSKYAQIGYDGFEDYEYDFGGQSIFRNAHFGFPSADSRDSSISDEDAHTGRYSIKVFGGKEASLQANLAAGTYEAPQPECEDDTPPPPPGDDDVVIGQGTDCHGNGGFLDFIFYGEPNTTFEFSYLLDRGGAQDCVDFTTTIDGIVYGQSARSIVMTYGSDGVKEFRARGDVLTGFFPGPTSQASYNYSKDGVFKGAIYMCQDQADDCNEGLEVPPGGGSGGGGSGGGSGGGVVVIEADPTNEQQPLQGTETNTNQQENQL